MEVMDNKFKLHSEYKPTGDQPQAIEELVQGFKSGNKFETLLGVTGSGKTFTMANVIERVQKPTLVIAHNKTLAAQLYGEFKEFFPENAVEYFVSYYDYYQPEAYVVATDTYIEKESMINDEIDKLRHSATAALSERNDVIIIASVSCIYGLGSPIDYQNMTVNLRPGMTKDRDEVLKKLVEIQYTRNDMALTRGTFRARGDVVEVFLASAANDVIRIEFFGDEVDQIKKIDLVTGNTIAVLEHVVIFPASHYVVSPEKMERAILAIENECTQRVDYFKKHDKLIEAQRIYERTTFDIEFLRETGFCSGIENYSMHLNGLKDGEPPHTLMDYFPRDMLIIVDESHMTIPQIRGMFNGDRARKTTLVDNGFRLPSALNNRPLNFKEFESHINQIMFVSATPSVYEEEHQELRVEQIIRPTGLLDPEITVKPSNGQVDDLIGQIRQTTKNKEKVLVTTLTKVMAEKLTDYLKDAGIRVKYLHSDVKTMERSKIVRDMRMDKFDVLVGINLLREGLDIPEVSLVAILDADKEGFLRSRSSLIQTIGRAARNVHGRVLMYADTITESMQEAIDETNRRREIQKAYNKANNITPKSIEKAIRDLITITVDSGSEDDDLSKDPNVMSSKDLRKEIKKIENRMNKAAAELDFEMAIEYRDQMDKLLDILNSRAKG